jgi:hypothetical protein
MEQKPWRQPGRYKLVFWVEDHERGIVGEKKQFILDFIQDTPPECLQRLIEEEKAFAALPKPAEDASEAEKMPWLEAFSRRLDLQRPVKEIFDVAGVIISKAAYAMIVCGETHFSTQPPKSGE